MFKFLQELLTFEELSFYYRILIRCVELSPESYGVGLFKLYLNISADASLFAMTK